MEITDKQLIEKFLKGNEPAFELLLKKHLKSVYNFLCRLTIDKAAAEDLTQETFVKIWKNLHRYDNSKNFKVWLFAIAKNTAFDFLRKKKSLPFASFTNGSGYNKLEEISEDKIIPEEMLEREVLSGEIEKKLNKLPSLYKVILLLHYQDDFSLQEIAMILERPYNTIKSQHQRALFRLKKTFLEDNASKKTSDP